MAKKGFPKTPKRQTRRSISVKGRTYQTALDYCKANDRSVSGLLEELIAEKMAAEKFPWAVVLRVHYPTKRTKVEVENERAACFSL